MQCRIENILDFIFKILVIEWHNFHNAYSKSASSHNTRGVNSISLINLCTRINVSYSMQNVQNLCMCDNTNLNAAN